MTFTEAAIEVLRREGKPLHFKKITEIAVRENLLDHVGKIPEEVMADQVAAHCRLPRLERKLVPVLAGTFALVEWGLDEDPQGLENLVETPPVDELPYRARERHPAPIREAARSSGRSERGEKRGRREEGDERRGRRFPPPAEVAYEILASAGQPLALAAIAAQGVERLLMPDAFVRELSALSAALAEDNHRRESAGRRPLFLLEGELVTLVAQPEPGERPVVAVAAAARVASPLELRRAGLAALRRRLRECDGATVEHLVVKLLERLGYREVKVAKRGREHVIYTARKRMGLADVRHCVRVVRSGGEAARRDVVDTRRDLGHYGAQIGLVVSAGEAGREARGEAGAGGQLPVVLLCGEALAEAFAEAALGCVQVVVPDVDEPFFAAAAEAASREEEARKARREERDRRDGERPERSERGERPERGERGERRDRGPERLERGEGRPAPVAGEPGVAPEQEAGAERPQEEAPAAEAGATPAVEVEAFTGAPPELSPSDDDEGDDDGPDDGEEGEGEGEPGVEAGAAGAVVSPDGKPAGEGGRRRRRRRRRRGGRGRGEKKEGGEAGAQAGPAQDGGGAPAPAEPSAPAASPAPPQGGADGASGA